MKVEYINNATINYNNSITAINTYLGEMAKEDINCAYIIGDYIEKCRSIRSYNMQFDNVYPYEGIKDNCIYISKIVDYLSECVSNLYEIGYWVDWIDFVEKKLGDRESFKQGIFMSIEISDTEDLSSTLDFFNNYINIDNNTKYEILDFLSLYHYEKEDVYNELVKKMVLNLVK